MNALQKTERVLSFANEEIAARASYSNIYFEELKNGAMTFEEFCKTQEQFYFAVSFFSRPMAALMARFPNPGSRLSILENIVEEHGSFSQTAFHESTFKEFLSSLNVDLSKLEQLSLWPEVRAFNSTLMTACVFDEPEVGVSCLGAVELMFATISSLIGHSVVERGWCSKENLKHYKLHAEIDVQHAADFFDIVEGSWGNEDKNYAIKQGVAMGVYIFDRLYKDLRASSLKI